jgi:hypothetical protein
MPPVRPAKQAGPTPRSSQTKSVSGLPQMQQSPYSRPAACICASGAPANDHARLRQLHAPIPQLRPIVWARARSRESLINLRIMAHCAFDSRATVWTGS